MKGGIGNLMRQAQQMQENLQKAQAELAALEVTGEAGGGMVKVLMNGKHEVRRVTIDPSVAGDDRELLEDLVTAAINDAVRKVESTTHSSAGSRWLLAQIGQSSASDSIRQRRHWPIVATACASARLISSAPSRSRSSRWKAMRCADFGPTPGRRLRAAISWASAGE